MHNELKLIGKIATKPELRTSATGVSYITFTVITVRNYTDSQKARCERYTHVPVIAWASKAEVIAKYAWRGMKIFIEARLDNDSCFNENTQRWDNDLQVVLEDFRFLDVIDKEEEF